MSGMEGEEKRRSGTVAWKIVVVCFLLAGIVAAVLLRGQKKSAAAVDRDTSAAAVGEHAGPGGPSAPARKTTEDVQPAGRATPPASGTQHTGTNAAESAALPKLLDLGAGACVACKMMEPVLDELRREYRGKLEVEFIDVWKNPGAADKFGIRMIPTQIFFAPDGRELWRHTGFISKDDIIVKWKELGFAF